MSLLIGTPPLWGSAAIELGNGTWSKRLLPVGQIEYQGRTLKFNRQYLEGLAEAFASRAYDQVPFQIADGKNTHTNDPERFRGEVQRMVVRDDGLHIVVKTTPAGNALLEANPHLGVSARIVEDYARSDGKYWPVAVQHVLGTLDPRIPELGPWQPGADLSNGEPDMIIDMSNERWADEPDWSDALEFADGEGHPLSPGIRKLAGRLASRHPATGAADHANAAADALDDYDVNGALLHLDNAHAAVPGDGTTQSDREISAQISKIQADAGHEVTDQQVPDGPLDAGRTDGEAMARRPKAAHDYVHANDGHGGYEFAGDPWGQPYQALELAHQQAAIREAEDAARLARRRTGTSVTEDRLSAAMARIGHGTYTPGTGQRALGFANSATDAVDRAAEQAGGWDYSICDCTEDGVPAMTRYHTLGCAAAELTPDIMGTAAVRDDPMRRAVQPAEDARGHVFEDQYGIPAGMTELLQAQHRGAAAQHQSRRVRDRLPPGAFAAGARGGVR